MVYFVYSFLVSCCVSRWCTIPSSSLNLVKFHRGFT
nr:MAG TPA: hypothetical protein [Inoviridae sp.]